MSIRRESHAINCGIVSQDVAFVSHELRFFVLVFYHFNIGLIGGQAKIGEEYVPNLYEDESDLES